SLALTGTAEDIYVGDAFTHDGIKITATWDDDTQTDVTSACEYTGFNMSETGTQEIIATYKEMSVKYNVNVTTIANTAETAYTPTKAIELIDAGKGLNVPVYVKGKVSSIASAWTSTNGYLSFYISEDGTEDKFEFYQNYKGADNVQYATAEETPNIGDEVVGYGKLTKYNTIYEFDAGNYIVSIERGKVLQYDESSCSVMLDAADNVFPTLTNTYGTSVTYNSSNTSVATIDAEGNITLVGLGTTTITATLEADNSVTASYTLNVCQTHTWDWSKIDYISESENEVVWSSNIAKMVLSKEYSQTNANNWLGDSDNTTREETRVYKDQKLTITPVDGITITKVIITSTESKYQGCFAVDAQWTNATTSKGSNYEVSVTPSDGTQSIVFTVGTATRATKVVVCYLGEPTVENKPLVATDADGAYYATFSSDRDVVFTNDVVVNAVTIEDGKLKLTALSTGNYTTTNSTTSTVTDGYYVPANTGVLIEALDAEMTYYTAAAEQTFASLPTTQLVAATADGVFTGNTNHKYYKLAYDDYEAKTKLGFYYGAADGAPFTVKKGLAYLAVPVVNGSSLAAGYVFGGNGGDDTTGINGIENDNVNETKTIYNLQGQRVERAAQRGIYIVNGKKVILK
ncbi:MAG: bacterial Ig-like domain-containing protein, partial [Prevotella sp.]